MPAEIKERLVRKSDLLAILITFSDDGKTIAADTKYRVGAWDTQDGEWVGEPKIVEEELLGSLVEDRAKINSALSVVTTNAVAIAKERQAATETHLEIAEAQAEELAAVRGAREEQAEAALKLNALFQQASAAADHNWQAFLERGREMDRYTLELCFRKKWYHRLTFGLFVKCAD